MKMFVKSLIVSLLAVSAVVGMVSCGKNNKDNESEESQYVVSAIPSSSLPEELRDEISKVMNIYEGDNPIKLNRGYVSKPHALLCASYDPEYNVEDSTVFFSDKYMAFEFTANKSMKYYSRQWDPEMGEYGGWYEETIPNMYMTGDGDNFSYFFSMEGTPHGFFVKQTMILSGTYTDNGIKDFKIAVLMNENLGDTTIYPKNTYRVIGDFDGLAENDDWLGKKDLEKTGLGNGMLDQFWNNVK
ncbi:MAG: hypothetical protein ACI358_07365 [Candidatus Limimorpha sp.]